MRHIYVKRDLYICQKRPSSDFIRPKVTYLYICQKRPVHMTKDVTMCVRERESCVVASQHTPLYTPTERESICQKRPVHMTKDVTKEAYRTCVSWDAPHMSKENYLYAQRDLQICQKRPAYMPKESCTHMATDACISVTRSLYLGVSYMNESWHICLKRPISNDYEVSMILYVTRSLYLGVSCMNESWRICQKRPISLPQEAHIFGNRPMDMSEEAYVYEKGHVKDTFRCNTATHCDTLQHTATHCNTLQHTAWKETCKRYLSHVSVWSGMRHMSKETPCVYQKRHHVHIKRDTNTPIHFETCAYMKRDTAI